MNLQGHNLSMNMTGADVALLQSELAQLGYAIAMPETGQHVFGSTTLQAVQDFQRKRGLAVTGIVDPITAKAINAAVDARPQHFSVIGDVHHQGGGPALSGLTVRALDKDLRSEELLGEAVIDQNGHYVILYTPDKFRRAEKKRADLFVRVFSPEGRQLTESGVYFNAPVEARVDPIVAPIPVVTLSEYEELLADLTPALGNVALTQLTEDDVAFLSGENGIRISSILMLQRAAHLAQEADLPTEAVYGWLGGLLPGTPPTDLDHLLDVPTAQLSTALVQAIDKNIVPARVRDSLASILERITYLLATRARGACRSDICPASGRGASARPTN